jgi:signal peptidase
VKSVRRVLAAVVLAAIVAGGVSLWHSGYRAYVVHTGSMTPTYQLGDLVIDKRAPKTVRIGEVITFRHSADTTDVVTHRIAGITATGLIHTKGDANATPDAWDIRPNQVRGEVVATVPRLGFVAVFLKQPAGIAALMTGVLVVALLYGLFFPGASETREEDTDGRSEPVPTPLQTLRRDAPRGVVDAADPFAALRGAPRPDRPRPTSTGRREGLAPARC